MSRRVGLSRQKRCKCYRSVRMLGVSYEKERWSRRRPNERFVIEYALARARFLECMIEVPYLYARVCFVRVGPRLRMKLRRGRPPGRYFFCPSAGFGRGSTELTVLSLSKGRPEPNTPLNTGDTTFVSNFDDTTLEFMVELLQLGSNSTNKLVGDLVFLLPVGRFDFAVGTDVSVWRGPEIAFYL